MAVEGNSTPSVDNPGDDVRAAIAELKGDAPAASAPASTPVSDDTAAATSQPTEGRPRDEHGRFLSKQTVEQDAPAAKPVSDADPQPASEPAPSTAPTAPKSWSAEAKAEFGKLSPAVQAAVLKRETEIDSGGARWSEEKRNYEQMLSPVAARARAAGVSPQEGLQRLIAADEFLTRDPARAIRWLANAYGVDLSKPSANPTPQPQADPALLQMSSQLNDLRSRLEMRDQQETDAQIQSFASSPGHEHFEAVKEQMGHLILTAAQMGRTLSMEDAYQQAVWGAPDLRSQLIEAQTRDAAKAAEDRAKAERAKRGAISVPGGPGLAARPSTTAPANSSINDDVRAAINQLRH